MAKSSDWRVGAAHASLERMSEDDAKRAKRAMLKAHWAASGLGEEPPQWLDEMPTETALTVGDFEDEVPSSTRRAFLDKRKQE
jgi:hypothetical protein